MDLIPLISVVVGGLLAIGGGFWASWVQHGREHERWVRERRYEAFTAILTLHNEMDSARIGRDTDVASGGDGRNPVVAEAYDAILKRFPAAVVPLAILGPEPVESAANDAMSAQNAGDQTALLAAEARMLSEMRVALQIKRQPGH